MTSSRRPKPRIFVASATVVDLELELSTFERPRMIRKTLIDFSSLNLPSDVRQAFAEAFWSYFGAMAEKSLLLRWYYIKIYDSFVRESGETISLGCLDRAMLLRYIDWLNARRNQNGQSWSKSARASAYVAVAKLLQWIERCRPGRLPAIDYPFNPFPWRNRDASSSVKIPAVQLRELLKACEEDIVSIRIRRNTVNDSRLSDAGNPGTLGWLLDVVDQRFGGVVPSGKQLTTAGDYTVRAALKAHGGLKKVDSYLYPQLESLLPYYLALLIHTAGNPDPIADLTRECIQDIPLLDDRKALVWFKPRANSDQRRTFGTNESFGPIALVIELLGWNERLLPLAEFRLRNRLFLYKGMRGVAALSSGGVKHFISDFCKRHALPRFSLNSIRPSVLTSFYRGTRDLQKVKEVANHAQLSTTVRYVQTPEVKNDHRVRIAALQAAFVKDIESSTTNEGKSKPIQPGILEAKTIPAGKVVSMFGFSCKDPLEGVSPGTQKGALCTNFMGCFTCPNSIISPDPLSIARLIQAAQHLRDAAAYLHPARWHAFYAPQLRILEEDILPRFSIGEFAAAQPLVSGLPPMVELR